jgi:hypothetical protein
VINGDSNSYASGYNTNFTQTASMYLFARNNIGAAVGNFFIGRIYYAKTYDNNTLVRNFVPAKRDSDDVLGMYDTVSGQFFTNAATSGPDFTAGPSAN